MHPERARTRLRASAAPAAHMPLHVACASRLHAALAPPCAALALARTSPRARLQAACRAGRLPRASSGYAASSEAAGGGAAEACDAQAAHDAARMRQALVLARDAAAAGEVPVGAVLVAGGRVLAWAHNRSAALCDPTAHAEMLCIRTAAAQLGGSHALAGATLYCTLEPCAMCAGALLQARVGTLVYGAPNPLVGADGSWARLLGGGGPGDAPAAPRPHAFHPRITVRRGVLQDDCAAVMRDFFRVRRAENADAAAAAAAQAADAGAAATRSVC